MFTPDSLQGARSKRELAIQRLQSDAIAYWADQPIEVPSSPDQVASVAERDELRHEALALQERDRLAQQLQPSAEKRGLDADLVAHAILQVRGLDVRRADGSVDLAKVGELLDALALRPSHGGRAHRW
jgi:hypothetical protein